MDLEFPEWEAQVLEQPFELSEVGPEEAPEVPLLEQRCRLCGLRGAHFCTGGQKPHPGWMANDKKP